MLVRQGVQSLATCVAANDGDDARSLSTHHTVIHRAKRLAASGRGDGCRGSQELVRNRTGTANARRRDKLVAALTRTSRGTVVGQVAVDHTSRGGADDASCGWRATQSYQGGVANRRISPEKANFAGDEGNDG